MTFETHPLQPFLPQNGRILFLGSFPPPKARWSMDFFYPNFINDFWRIMGLIHFGDTQHFVMQGEAVPSGQGRAECGSDSIGRRKKKTGTAKRFNRERIIEFAQSEGLAFFDTATRVCRLKDNASDEHLQIVEATDICALLEQMSGCHDIVTTGGKASEQLQLQIPFAMPRIGEYTEGEAFGRVLRWWRMPSSSRAYPMRIEQKAEFYARLFKGA